jgi:hypothetical protein
VVLYMFLNQVEYKKYLFCSSFFMLFASIISYIKNDIYKGIYYIILFITSINFWRDPIHGLRRNMDLSIVYFGVLFTLTQLYLLKDDFYMYCILSMCLCCLVFYIMEFICVTYLSNKWVIYHMTLHLYASLIVVFILFD